MEQFFEPLVDSTGSKRERNNSFSSFRSLRIRFPREKVSTTKNSCSTTRLRGGGKMRNDVSKVERTRKSIFQSKISYSYFTINISNNKIIFIRSFKLFHLILPIFTNLPTLIISKIFQFQNRTSRTTIHLKSLIEEQRIGGKLIILTRFPLGVSIYTHWPCVCTRISREGNSVFRVRL